MMTRTNFLKGLSGSLASIALPACVGLPTGGTRKPRIALQLYSIRTYIERVGIAKALEDVAAIGYAGVEVAGYDAKARTFYNATAPELDRLLRANGLELCGMHVSRTLLAPDAISSVCDYARTCGNTTLICPGSGNMPKGVTWANHHRCRELVLGGLDDHVRFLCDFYNRAAADGARHGCRVGIHNHQWEFLLRTSSGETLWDCFFSNTDPAVAMEQDVGWTTAAGFDPCEQYVKYPHRSPTLHAKENGYGCAGPFDAILGEPGKNADGTSVKRVEWERLSPVAEADGVVWFVVECERHEDDLSAVGPSFEFLRRNGF